MFCDFIFVVLCIVGIYVSSLSKNVVLIVGSCKAGNSETAFFIATSSSSPLIVAIAFVILLYLSLSDSYNLCLGVNKGIATSLIAIFTNCAASSGFA